jgi:hypothetical protein
MKQTQHTASNQIDFQEGGGDFLDNKRKNYTNIQRTQAAKEKLKLLKQTHYLKEIFGHC